MLPHGVISVMVSTEDCGSSSLGSNPKFPTNIGAWRKWHTRQAQTLLFSRFDSERADQKLRTREILTFCKIYDILFIENERRAKNVCLLY